MKKQAITLLLILAGFTSTYAQSYPEMVTVAGGTFTMGDTKMEGDKDEQPTHTVTLNSFKIAKTETTVAQWKAFCTATGRSMPETPSWGWEEESRPIVNVTYEDATSYCEWLTKKMYANYRLPTEAEWEYAARGGKLSKGTKYSGSDEPDDVAFYNDGKSYFEPDLVGEGKPNELGIYDMSGNVWEWCKDWYSAYNAKSQTNPKAATSGSKRVTRGGSFSFSAACCRVAHRHSNDPSSHDADGGFRVVLAQ